MVKQIKTPKQPKPRKIIISTEFVINLARVKNYGEELFGKAVSDKFVKEIRQKIAFLSKQPDANPKNRFLESTEKENLPKYNSQELLCFVFYNCLNH